MVNQMPSRWFAVVLSVCMLVSAAGAAQVIYVDDDAPAGGGSSWTDTCKYVQDALAIAATAAKPVEIRVAQGLYKPDQGAAFTPGDQTASFQLLNGVTLKGGYAGIGASDPNARDVSLYETILSGDLAGNDGGSGNRSSDDSCHIVVGSLTDETAVLDGVTITGGDWTSSTVCWFRPGGNARMFVDAGSPTIRNCRFTASQSTEGAVGLLNGSAPTFTDCVFTDNDTAMRSVSCSPTLVNCLFLANRMDEAVHCGGSGAVSLTGCRFESIGIGVEISGPIDLTLMDCTFVGNRTALSVWGGAANASNCVFESNRLGVEGASGDLMFARCEFRGHTGGVILGGADVTLMRCSITDNSGGLAPLMMSSNTVMVSDCTFTDNFGLSAGAILGGRFLTLRNCEFSGNVGGRTGAVYAGMDVFRAANCLFTGNSGQRTGALYSDAAVFSLSNCTFADNRGQVNAIRYEKPGPASPAEMVQCIVWDGPEAVFEKYPARGLLGVAYCDVQGGHEGEGNIDADPCFVAPGYWADPNDPSIVLNVGDSNAVWVRGDYHLKSQAGHWDRAIEGWVLDDVTSPCIDAGNPNGFIGEEPFPNGGFVNLGAYGGTAEASRTYFGGPVCENQLAGDINGDCVVDQTDMDILTSHWLMQSWPTSNEPPTIVIVEPADGDEFSEAAPITIRAEAFDPDGSVIKVAFSIEYVDATGGIGMGRVDADPSDGWTYAWPWPDRATAGSKQVWTIRAEAMDDHGNLAVSPEVKVTLHLKK